MFIVQNVRVKMQRYIDVGREALERIRSTLREVDFDAETDVPIPPEDLNGTDKGQKNREEEKSEGSTKTD